jgi:polygalacturonase
VKSHDTAIFTACYRMLLHVTALLIFQSTIAFCQNNHTSDTARSDAAHARVFNIKSHGAVGDGIAMETDAIQKAIDACHTAGGGVVRVPAGDFQIGTIRLKSNVTLSLDHGASLLGSTKMADYRTEGLRPAREGNSECLLYAEDATNIRLEGLGVIDGRGKPEFFPKRSGPGGRDNRPRLIRFENCENLTFSGLTYKNPAFWGIHLVDCRKVHFNGVTIRMRNNHSNNDGMDIDGCEKVLIENCDIDSGDDAICLKSSKNPCRKVSSHTAALKCGTSSSGGFIDVDVSNCYFYDCPMGAIKLQSVDGGRMENVNISRIVMENVGSPIFIRLGNRGRNYTRNTATGPNTGSGNSEGARVGSIKGVRISDVVAKVTFADRAKDAQAAYKGARRPSSPDLTEREMAQAGPIMIAGIPGHHVEDVVLENISVSFPGGGTAEDVKRVVPEDIARYPEQYFFGVLPSWGAYVRHARNVEFKNVAMQSRAPDQRKKVVLDDVEGFVEH